MPERVDVWYEGWGERWHWGSLVSSTAITGRPLIAFEYGDEALRRGLELSAHTLPLKGPRLRHGFPVHQLGLPGPVYDALPDGWGLLLMDRLFKQRGLNPARIGPLGRLAYVGRSATGALSFEPPAADAEALPGQVLLGQLAAEVQEVQRGEGGAFLQRLLQIGGSPQGARPKVLLYREPATGTFSTADAPGLEPWLVKFPAQHEPAEVCAIEAAYAQAQRDCGIDAPATEHFALPGGQAAFGSRRFDREAGLRVPIQSLAAFTGADFRTPGALDAATFLRATLLCTNDVRERTRAYERVVFNVAFHNRDDHPKNFAYRLSARGHWQLAPAFDVTFCEGPGGYHQMDVMGEALDIGRAALLRLGEQEAELSRTQASETIERIAAVASGFAQAARQWFPGLIAPDTLALIQRRIDDNLRRMR